MDGLVTMGTVPQVTIRTNIDGRDEVLSEYLCDWPGCPNIATEALGVVRALRIRSAVCAEHAQRLGRTPEDDPRN